MSSNIVTLNLNRTSPGKVANAWANYPPDENKKIIHITVDNFVRTHHRRRINTEGRAKVVAAVLTC